MYGEDQVSADLRHIAAWASAIRGEASLRSVLTLRTQELPKSVAISVNRILDADASHLAGPDLALLDVKAAISRLFQDMDDRDQIILREGVFPLEPRTLTSIAGDLNVTRERVRQLRNRTLQRVETFLGSPEGRPVRWKAQSLRHILGAAAPENHPLVVQQMTSVKRQVGSFVGSERIPVDSLLLHLAGPYNLDREWFVRRDRSDIVDGIEADLRRVSGVLGVVSFKRGREIIEKCIRLAFADRWVGQRTSFEIRAGVGYVDCHGGFAARAERALRRLGTPSTVEEILAEVGEHQLPVSARQIILGAPTIHRVTLEKFALVEWGGREYTNISDLIAHEIKRRGGEATLTDVAITLGIQFGIRESSVKSIVGTPRFVVHRGRLRLRRDSDAAPDYGAVADTANCYRHRDAWVIRVPVDQDVLRGSGRGCPTAFAQHIGVGVGDELTVDIDGCDVKVSWHYRSAHPSFGTLRAVAGQLRAARGDWLFLDLTPESPRAWIVREAAMASSSGMRKALHLMGYTSSVAQQGLAALTRALDLPPSATLSEVVTVLKRRGEDDLADLVQAGPEQEGSE